MKLLNEVIIGCGLEGTSDFAIFVLMSLVSAHHSI